eukprot:scaffold106130_cov24-Prasinocladus_malaysianus.AAC.1
MTDQPPNWLAGNVAELPGSGRGRNRANTSMGKKTIHLIASLGRARLSGNYIISASFAKL